MHVSILQEPYTREHLEATLSRACAIRAVRVAASAYIEDVRAACSEAGTRATTGALAAAAAHIDVVRANLKPVGSSQPDGPEDP